MASPPFNINQAIPGDADIVSQHPANARTFRDVVESWIILLTGGNVDGHFDKVSIKEVGSDPTFSTAAAGFWNRAGVIKYRDEAGAITNVATDKASIDAAIALKADQTAVDLKAPLASPVFTGNPTGPTPAAADNDTSLATTAYVQTELGFMPRYVLHMQDQKTSSTDGGDFTSGAARTRVLNTTVKNTIPSASHNTGTSQFTLPAGTYRIWAYATAFNVNQNVAWLRNTSDGSDTLIGSPNGGTVAMAFNTMSIIDGEFTIAATKTFEIQHQCTTTRTIDGFGLANSFKTNIYTDVMIQKIR